MAQLEGVIEGGTVINVEIIGTGPQGRDGYTPIKGVDYFDGVDGTDGKDGKDGDTPVKGVDYFTPEEVSSIESKAAEKAAAVVSQDIAAETIRAMEAEDNRIKKFYTNNLGAVSVADSDDGSVRNLVVGGRSDQLTTTGAQLADFRNIIFEGNGVKVEFDEFGVCVISGTPTVTSGLLFTKGSKNVNLSLLTIGDTYEFIGGTGCTIKYADRTDYKRTFEYTSDITSISCYIQRTAEKYVDGEILKPMLRKVGSDIEWEPYTGGVPSPSADYPQEIKSVENCTMTVSGAGGTKTQIVPIPFTLRGNGDVRDELYVYADGSGKLVQRFPDMLDPTKTVAEQALTEPIETMLAAEQVKALFDLRTYYGGTNVSFESENGLEPSVNFDYACALENFVAYIKAAQGDDRQFIYDMADRMTDAEYVAALAYVNSEYAAALTELEV